MRYVERKDVTLPGSVSAKAKTELDAIKAHRNDPDPKKGAFEFKVYKSEEIKQALEKLFHGKCAYCETFYSASAPVDVEHYRPKGAVAELKEHPGYWWVAMDWENLLPSCIDCNRKRKQKFPSTATSLEELWKFGKDARNFEADQSGKKDSFPVASTGTWLVNEESDFGREPALLINPCKDRPEHYLAYNVAMVGRPAIVHSLDGNGKDSRGNASIHIYGLNRLGLVQERTRVLRQLEFIADIVIEVTEIADKVEALPAAQKVGIQQVPGRLRMLRERMLDELKAMTEPRAPYSAMARAWLENFMRKFA
jgi:uncharacterized protein (TIGR02646 family)